MKTIDLQEVIDILEKNEISSERLSESFGVDHEVMTAKIRKMDGAHILGTKTHSQTVSRALEAIIEHADNSSEAMYLMFHLFASHFRNHYQGPNPMEMFAKAMASKLAGE